MTEAILTLEQLAKIVLEIRGLPKWWLYEKEIDPLRDSYMSVAFDETDKELRWRQCETACVNSRDFYRCNAEAFEKAKRITREEIRRRMARNEEIKEKFRKEKSE